MPRTLWLALGLTALLLLIRWDRASAHAVIERTDPADPCLAIVGELPPVSADCLHGNVLTTPPTVVRLLFSEPIQPFGEGIRVTGPSGQRADQGPVRLAGPALVVAVDARQPGTYVVSWQVVSYDTHPTVGRFAFSVGQTSAVDLPPPAVELGAVAPLGLGLQVIARWLHFVGFALGFGVLTVVVWPPGKALADWPVARASPGRELRTGRAAAAAERAAWKLVSLGVMALLLAEPIALLGQTASLGAASMLDPAVMSNALDSSFGRAFGLRLGAALALWIVVGIAKEGAKGAAQFGLGIGALLAGLDGTAAHASGVQPIWLGLAVNAVHLVAMGAWVGSVAALLIAVRQPELAGFRGEIARAVANRAALAILAVGLSGLILLSQHLAAPTDLIGTDYGRTLLGKSAVVAGALALGWLAGRQAARGAWRYAEALALLGALALAGLLVSLPPPR